MESILYRGSGVIVGRGITFRCLLCHGSFLYFGVYIFVGRWSKLGERVGSLERGFHAKDVVCGFFVGFSVTFLLLALVGIDSGVVSLIWR